MNFPDAKIAVCRCKKVGKSFGIRFEQWENEWKATWAFPIKKEGSVKRENYDRTKLTGNIIFDNDYPGCPYCGRSSMLICTCGGINCYGDDKEEVFTCSWCGNSGIVVDYTGSGFNFGGDR
jgi:hypothetical protein